MKTRHEMLIIILAVALFAMSCNQSKPENQSWIASGERLVQLARSHQAVHFNELSGFAYYGKDRQIPPAILALNGKKVAIKGMVMPTVTDVDGINEFLLTPYLDGCCWGGFSSTNEFVLVKLDKKTQELRGFEEITVFGELTVKEELEGGQPVSLYKMRAEAAGTFEGMAEISSKLTSARN
jgi:hypothetical protein